jgi:hypothetical protein
MKRCWFIRGFIIALLMLCIGGWASSYLRSSFITYDHSVSELCLGFENGMLCLGLKKIRSPAYDPIYIGPPNEQHFLGFFILIHRVTPWSQFEVGIPFWCPTGLLAALLIYAWRKTSRPKPLKAFPVEVGRITS